MFSGCATEEIDWTARMGNYTFDQAVKDFGPPDKSAKLSDGTTVADWLTQRGVETIEVEPYLRGPHGFYGPIVPYSEFYSPNYYMRLTFDADGRLKAYKDFAK